MDALYESCCGLDVHKKSIVACLFRSGPDGKVEKRIKPFGTTTPQLREMAAWLKEADCTHVAMESTGSYWKPVYNMLEEDFILIVVNSRNLKIIPGRKSDVKDAEWIADLLRHGLLRASFIPSREDRELRELTRYRTSLVGLRSSEINRIQKVLEGGNIKLASVASDVMGKSGREILQAMVLGVEDPSALAELARGRLRSAQHELEEALTGLVGPHQRFMLGGILRHIDYLDGEIDRLSTEIEERLRPFEEQKALLRTIPGVGNRTAEVLLAEAGHDMSRFPSAKHFASWAALSPGLNESAGKRRSGRTLQGNPWLSSALVQAAHAASRTRSTLGARYHRLRPRIGPNKTSVAVARSILVAVYAILRDHTEYDDSAFAYFDRGERERAARHLARNIQRLGFEVIISPPAA